jgi:propionyl-CoA carboxylase alpha chain
VAVGHKTYHIQSQTGLGEILVTGTVNGQPFTAQVERGMAKNPLALRIAHNGTRSTPWCCCRVRPNCTS